MWGTFFKCTTPILHTFGDSALLWPTRPVLGAGYTDIMNIIFSSFPIFWRWPYAELQPVKDNHYWCFLSGISLTKTVEIAIFCCGCQARSMVSSQYMSVSSTFEWSPGLFHTRTSSFMYRHVRQYFSTSSLIARPVNGSFYLLVD